jgi:mannose-6-phosphate isomerase-like protein (cupin superfamily)
VTRPWRTKDLAGRPNYTSPAGVAEIRLLPSFPTGELAHARIVSRQPSRSARLVGVGELFYVLSGEGELWRRTGGLSDVSQLVPRRCVSLPPGIDYQYRVSGGTLDFIVLTAPRWKPDNWTDGETSHWNDDGSVATRARRARGPWVTVDLPEAYDYLAPDGSEIRLLPTYDAGGLAHCRLPAGATTDAVRHRTVVEVWYVVAGTGEIWRATDAIEEVVELRPGRALTIPVGTSFQFRAGAQQPLEILIGTFPRWPGPGEAVTLEGHWHSTHRQTEEASG